MKKLLLLCIIPLFSTTLLFSQEKPIEKPIRIGIELGAPNVYGLNFEYVTPMLNARLAPTIDFSYFNVPQDDCATCDVDFTYLELGANYYFKKAGKGTYGHISFGRMGLQATDNQPLFGYAEGNGVVNLLNAKIGAKIGNTIYFRLEIGYCSVISSDVNHLEYTEFGGDPQLIPLLTREIKLPSTGGIAFGIGFGIAL